MIFSFVEAATRSFAFAIAVRVGIAIFRVRDPQQEKLVWTAVLISALAMPWLQDWTVMQVLPAASFRLPSIEVHVDSVRTILDGGGWTIRNLYWVVTVALLIRLAIGIGRMLHIRRTAHSVFKPWTVGLDVRVARQLSAPATFGSTILLPVDYSSWSDNELAMILQHESSHVRHRDSLINLLAIVHCCLFWFSPLSWWLRRRLAELSEQTSDDAVLQNQSRKYDYAELLLEMTQRKQPTHIALGIAAKPLEKRIDRILSNVEPQRPASLIRNWLTTFAVIPLLAIAADATTSSAQGPASTTHRPMYGMDASQPHIIASPTEEELERYYPPQAQRKGIAGMVRIAVRLDESGRASDTRVLHEAPLGMGFGVAASKLAHVFKYANDTGHSTTLAYRIQFALHDPPPEPTRGSQ
jgi:hypothetical protein